MRGQRKAKTKGYFAGAAEAAFPFAALAALRVSGSSALSLPRRAGGVRHGRFYHGRQGPVS